MELLILTVSIIYKGVKKLEETPNEEVVEFTGRIVAQLDEGSEEKDGKNAEVVAGTQSEEELEELEEEYELYAEECEAALNQVLLSIETLSKAIDRAGKRNPFGRIESRMKTFKSVRGKCKARGYELSMASIREHVKDVAGCRIITMYIDDVMKVKDLISQIPGINIIRIKDYITIPKPNGYSSMHLACQVAVYDPFSGSRLMPVEIQIRSNGMNMWAALEHDLKYKNLNPVPNVEEMFSKIAKIIRDFEEEAINIRNLSMAAAENSTAASRVSDVREQIEKTST